jgi:hypothetical protein
VHPPCAPLLWGGSRLERAMQPLRSVLEPWIDVRTTRDKIRDRLAARAHFASVPAGSVPRPCITAYPPPPYWGWGVWRSVSARHRSKCLNARFRISRRRAYCGLGIRFGRSLVGLRRFAASS